MSDLSNIVVSLDLSKQLKEVGYKQESLHWWGGIGNYGIWCNHIKNDLPKSENRFVWFAAPTVSELLKLLPSYDIQINGLNNGYDVIWQHPDQHANIRELRLVDALAKMYIYLKQQELI